MPFKYKALKQISLNELQRTTALKTDQLPSGWARVRHPDDPSGVALDPVMHRIWSAATGRTLEDIARVTDTSTHLAARALAAMAHAGLLKGHLASTSSQTKTDGLPSRLPITALVVHSCGKADLARCCESVMSQQYPALSEIRVLASAPFDGDVPMVPIATCNVDRLASTMLDQIAALSDSTSVLLINSHLTLTPGALAEMAEAMRLPGPIAAAAPRIMWRRWDTFATQVGDWRSSDAACAAPYAGHLDLGQFRRRWLEVPAFAASCGLINAEALLAIGLPRSSARSDQMWSDWCRRARSIGYHVLATTQGLAVGPWPEPDERPVARRNRTRSRNLQPGAMVLPGPGPLLHAREPALTLDSIRGTYSQYPAMVPASARSRIALVAKTTPRARGMASALNEFCDVDWLVPGVAPSKLLRQLCESADVVITTAEFLDEVAFLQGWHCPVLVDVQPPVSPIRTPELWPQAFDGLICATDEEHQYWLDRLTSHGHNGAGPNRSISALAEMIMVVPTGVEPGEPSTEQTLTSLHPEVTAEDKIILWPGGLQAYNDPLTAILAFAAILPDLENVRLIIASFEGSPQDEDTAWAAMQLVKKLGLGRLVLFPQHIPDHQRQMYWTNAHVAVSLGNNTAQSKLIEPAGLVDCIGASLPIVITGGHAGSVMIQQLGIGQAVPAGDVNGLGHAFVKYLQTPSDKYKERFDEARRALTWEKAITPLASLCRNPEHVLGHETTILLDRNDLFTSTTGPTPIGALPAKAWRSLRRQGLRATAGEMLRYAQWKVGV